MLGRLNFRVQRHISAAVTKSSLCLLQKLLLRSYPLQSQKLPYPLLSDESGKLRNALGVKKHYFIIPGRQTFVIDKTGRVLLAYHDLSHKRHAKEAINALYNSGK